MHLITFKIDFQRLDSTFEGHEGGERKYLLLLLLIFMNPLTSIFNPKDVSGKSPQRIRLFEAIFKILIVIKRKGTRRE